MSEDIKDLIENCAGPHEWGYRDLAEGGFISDDAPFRASEVLASQTEEITRLRREAHEHHEIAKVLLREKNEEITRLRAEVIASQTCGNCSFQEPDPDACNCWAAWKARAEAAEVRLAEAVERAHDVWAKQLMKYGLDEEPANAIARQVRALLALKDKP